MINQIGVWYYKEFDEPITFGLQIDYVGGAVCRNFCLFTWGLEKFKLKIKATHERLHEKKFVAAWMSE